MKGGKGGGGGDDDDGMVDEDENHSSEESGDSGFSDDESDSDSEEGFMDIDSNNQSSAMSSDELHSRSMENLLLESEFQVSKDDACNSIESRNCVAIRKLRSQLFVASAKSLACRLGISESWDAKWIQEAILFHV